MQEYISKQHRILRPAEIWSAERWAAIENEAFSSGALEQAMAEMGL